MHLYEDSNVQTSITNTFLFFSRGVLNELWNIFSNEILHVSINKKTQMTSDVEYEDPLPHLRLDFATITCQYDLLTQTLI